MQSLFIADPTGPVLGYGNAIRQFSGFAMAIYLAALRAIPEELTEACRIDGATSGRFWSDHPAFSEAGHRQPNRTLTHVAEDF